MKRSEFFEALDLVYGESLGRSLVVDLLLPKLGMTAAQALERGDQPSAVWAALIEETGKSEKDRWAHRMERKKTGHTSP